MWTVLVVIPHVLNLVLISDLITVCEFYCYNSELDDTDNEYENRRGCICVIL